MGQQNEDPPKRNPKESGDCTGSKSETSSRYIHIECIRIAQPAGPPTEQHFQCLKLTFFKTNSEPKCNCQKALIVICPSKSRKSKTKNIFCFCKVGIACFVLLDLEGAEIVLNKVVMCNEH